MEMRLDRHLAVSRIPARVYPFLGFKVIQYWSLSHLGAILLLLHALEITGGAGG
jgi:hypothetical protein